MDTNIQNNEQFKCLVEENKALKFIIYRLLQVNNKIKPILMSYKDIEDVYKMKVIVDKENLIVKMIKLTTI